MADLVAGVLFDVSGRWVAITGAASGIGRMLAKGFTANGAHTILIDINQEQLLATKAELEDVAKSAHVAATSVITVCGDLSTEDGVRAIVQEIKAVCSSLDALIHCAAIRRINKVSYAHGESLQKLEEATCSLSYAELEQSYRVNVFAPYFLTAGLTSLLGEAAKKGDGRGCVILFSSPASVHNHQFVPAYQLTKASVDHLVRILAMEFASFYIRVNAISPGIVPSSMCHDSDPTSNLQAANEAPAGRPGGIQDMVGTALWLASKAGSFMDGKIVRIEGGRLLTLRGVLSNSD